MSFLGDALDKLLQEPGQDPIKTWDTVPEGAAARVERAMLRAEEAREMGEPARAERIEDDAIALMSEWEVP